MPRLPVFKPLRRKLIQGLGYASTATLFSSKMATVLAQGVAPPLVTSERLRPQMPGGVMSGDVSAGSAVLWGRTDRAARMIVDYADNPHLQNAVRRIGPNALEATGFTAHLALSDLPRGVDVYYRVQFQDGLHETALSEPLTGRLRTPSAQANRPVCFVFSGDEAGQGWGINERFGGYLLYEAMRREAPDFFIHSGDQIYADGPIQAEVILPDGTLWTNLVTEAKSHVAQTLDDFRAAFAYNQLDINKRRFAAEVPFLVQWDDHEVRNNWYPGQHIGPAERRYQERSASVLAARGRQAMFEYNPIRINPLDPEQIYRAFQYGPLLDVFMLDERSYRGPNSANRQTVLGAEAAMLGRAQTTWLKQSLKRSTATWKVIASDMPISLIVRDLNPDVPAGSDEGWANGDHGVPLGREKELADILRFIKHEDIRNVVWVTADVHYAQATHYHPSRATFTDFNPFWEFIGGPINAGTFGPGELDKTFGPELRYVSIPADNPQNQSPAARQQFYGRARIDPATQAMTVSLHDLDGQSLWSVLLSPEV